MATMHLTKRVIERLQAPTASGKQELIWDEDLKGFGILVSGKTGAKSFIVQRSMPDGRAKRVTIGATNTLDLDGSDGARARAAKLLVQLGDGVDPVAQKRKAAQRGATLGNVLDAYLASRKDLRDGTAADYRATITRRLSDWLDRPMRDITPEQVEARHAKIAADVARRRQERAKVAERDYVQPEHWLSTAGAHEANACFRIVRLLWNWQSERDPELPSNPVTRLKRAWFPAPRRERVVTEAEMPSFYQAVRGLANPVARDYILLMLFTGLRREEAAALKWTEVDFEAKLIRLPAKRTKAKRKLDLPMSSHVRGLLVARRALGDDHGWVFPANSKSGHIEEPASTFEAIAEACGIRVSSHDLRRTFITIAESTDISILALKALVNHSIGSDVTSGYVQMATERLREPVEKVADRIAALCGIAEPEAEGVKAEAA